MANVVELNFPVDSALKHDAEIVLNNLGLSMATAIDIYLKQITLILAWLRCKLEAISEAFANPLAMRYSSIFTLFLVVFIARFLSLVFYRLFL